MSSLLGERIEVITQYSALLTGRRVVWSLRCPRFFLQVGVGGVEEAAKVGLSFPREGRLPPEALLPVCLKIPTGRRGEKKDRFRQKKMESKQQLSRERMSRLESEKERNRKDVWGEGSR